MDSRRTATVTSKQYCQLFVLTRQDLRESLSLFPGMESVIATCALGAALRVNDQNPNILTILRVDVLTCSAFVCSCVCEHIACFKRESLPVCVCVRRWWTCARGSRESRSRQRSTLPSGWRNRCAFGTTGISVTSRNVAKRFIRGVFTLISIEWDNAFWLAATKL